MPNRWDQVQIDELKNWGKILRKKISKEEQRRKDKEIWEKVEMRFGTIEKNKKRMLQSLLSRPYNKVTLDRVLVEKNSGLQNSELFSKEAEVKQQVVLHFQKQFRKRKQKFSQIREE